jgi:hypothetical protein
MKNFILLVLGFIALAQQAYADATLSAPSFAMEDVGIVAIALATGLAAFWGIKKGLSLIR